MVFKTRDQQALLLKEKDKNVARNLGAMSPEAMLHQEGKALHVHLNLYIFSLRTERHCLETFILCATKVVLHCSWLPVKVASCDKAFKVSGHYW